MSAKRPQAFASVRKRSQASASVRKRPQASASVRGGSDMPEARKSSRNVELSSLFTFRITKVSTITGIGGVVVAKPRTVVTFGFVSFRRVSKVSTVAGIRGGCGGETQNCRHFWTRLGSSRLKSVNSHRDSGGGVVVAKRRTVVTFGFVSFRRVSKVSTVTGIRGGGVVVAKRRTVVTFGLISGRRVSKVSTVTGIRGGVVVAKRRTVVAFEIVSGLRVSKVSTVTGIRGGCGGETQNCCGFWTRLGSSRLKSVNSHRDRGGRGGETQNCRRF